MDISFRIRRYNPEAGRSKPYWQEFTLNDVEPTQRVLELLHRVKWEQDGTLAFRRSCSSGICGSDAMRINGRNALACKLLARDVGPKIQVEPILGLRVIKDMIVDMEPFLAHYRQVLPWFVNDGPLPADGRERLQTQQDKDLINDSTNCILCAACTTSCPSFWANGEYVGPAAIVQAHRFLFDSRDTGDDARLDVLGAPDGVWRCRTIFNCTPACPRGIEVTRAIGEVKLAVNKGSSAGIIDPATIKQQH
ncbi:MAG: succinate dehydrogenase iron-sulfur subunit [Anaerolineae bacterium]|nr:succinate dehydrogenase iron-sulfur subunit [Anaerolineae bacterium]